MKTPATGQGLHQNDDLPPLDAILEAWMTPGPHPRWHLKAQSVVRDAMPVLAHHLDRLAQKDEQK